MKTEIDRIIKVRVLSYWFGHFKRNHRLWHCVFLCFIFGWFLFPFAGICTIWKFHLLMLQCEILFPAMECTCSVTIKRWIVFAMTLAQVKAHSFLWRICNINRKSQFLKNLCNKICVWIVWIIFAALTSFSLLFFISSKWFFNVFACSAQCIFFLYFQPIRIKWWLLSQIQCELNSNNLFEWMELRLAVARGFWAFGKIQANKTNPFIKDEKKKPEIRSRCFVNHKISDTFSVVFFLVFHLTKWKLNANVSANVNGQSHQQSRAGGETQWNGQREKKCLWNERIIKWKFSFPSVKWHGVDPLPQPAIFLCGSRKYLVWKSHSNQPTNFHV